MLGTKAIIIGETKVTNSNLFEFVSIKRMQEKDNTKWKLKYSMKMDLSNQFEFKGIRH